MSQVPQSIKATVSNESLTGLRNKPEAYWIIYDNSWNKMRVNLGEQEEDQVDERSWQDGLKEEEGQSVCNKQAIVSILANISKEYATQRFINLVDEPITIQKIEEVTKSIEQEFKKFKLTKRNLVFSILISSVTSSIQQHISSVPYFSKLIKFYHHREVESKIRSPEKSSHRRMSPENSHRSPENSSNRRSPENSPRKMKLSRNSSIIMGSNVWVDLKKPKEQIEQELIKQMKLDFIWLGVVSRLGSDVASFTQTVIEQQDFTPEYIGFHESFFSHLNSLLCQQSLQLNQQSPEPNPASSSRPTLQSLLKLSSTKASHQTESINACTQQLIRSKFNSRIILNDIVSTGDYLTLLLSRNYFNLLYIECDTLFRFQQFKAECNARFKELAHILTLEHFITIDDYWYRTFILQLLPHVNFILDRGSQSTPYQQLINKNHKQIIPPYRPNFDQYFLSVCHVLKQRSGCLKQAVGSIIVKDKRIIATGYNGTPIDCVNCFNGGCKVCNNSQKMNTQVLSCTCIHAEYGCILEAGIKITPESTLYSTKLPCLWCCKLIVQGRISKIVCVKSNYPHLEYENIAVARDILTKANVELVEVESTKNFISQ